VRIATIDYKVVCLLAGAILVNCLA